METPNRPQAPTPWVMRAFDLVDLAESGPFVVLDANGAIVVDGVEEADARAIVAGSQMLDQRDICRGIAGKLRGWKDEINLWRDEGIDGVADEEIVSLVRSLEELATLIEEIAQ
jgi:hypothetical protein